VRASPPIRKTLLTVHVATSVGWLGAVAAYMVLNVPALTATDDRVARAAYLMMEPVLLYAVVPLAVLSFTSGVVQALLTPWGLFRHYWVLISLLATGFAFVVLILHIPAVSEMAEGASDPTADVAVLGGDLVHSVGGALVLLLPLVLNIFKPRGLTPYGWRVSQGRAGGPERPSRSE
jgi:hypothetical protein